MPLCLDECMLVLTVLQFCLLAGRHIKTHTRIHQTPRFFARPRVTVVVPSSSVGARFQDLLTSSYAAATSSATPTATGGGGSSSDNCSGSGIGGGSGEGRGVIVTLAVVVAADKNSETPPASGDNASSRDPSSCLLSKEVQEGLQDWDFASDLVVVAPACSTCLDVLHELTHQPTTREAMAKDGGLFTAPNGTPIAVAKPTAAALTKALVDAGLIGGRNGSRKLAKGNCWVWD